MGQEAQAVGPGASPTAISWTGGKDCNLALLKAWRDPSLRVTMLVVFRPENAVFRCGPLSSTHRIFREGRGRFVAPLKNHPLLSRSSQGASAGSYGSAGALARASAAARRHPQGRRLQGVLRFGDEKAERRFHPPTPVRSSPVRSEFRVFRSLRGALRLTERGAAQRTAP